MAKILIVDDSDFFRQIYVKALTEAGYGVEQALNGRDAMDKMLASPPDMVFLDLVMPVMTGEEVLAEMKKNETTKNIPVVMLTSISADVKGADLLSIGSLAAYMTKDTAQPEDILKKVHEILETSGADLYPAEAAQAPAQAPPAAPVAPDPSQSQPTVDPAPSTDEPDDATASEVNDQAL
jgi:CheY-like chemotaxis protein